MTGAPEANGFRREIQSHEHGTKMGVFERPWLLSHPHVRRDSLGDLVLEIAPCEDPRAVCEGVACGHLVGLSGTAQRSGGYVHQPGRLLEG